MVSLHKGGGRSSAAAVVAFSSTQQQQRKASYAKKAVSNKTGSGRAATGGKSARQNVSNLQASRHKPQPLLAQLSKPVLRNGYQSTTSLHKQVIESKTSPLTRFPKKETTTENRVSQPTTTVLEGEDNLSGVMQCQDLVSPESTTQKEVTERQDKVNKISGGVGALRNSSVLCGSEQS